MSTIELGTKSIVPSDIKSRFTTHTIEVEIENNGIQLKNELIHEEVQNDDDIYGANLSESDVDPLRDYQFTKDIEKKRNKKTYKVGRSKCHSLYSVISTKLYCLEARSFNEAMTYVDSKLKISMDLHKFKVLITLRYFHLWWSIAW